VKLDLELPLGLAHAAAFTFRRSILGPTRLQCAASLS
jgi:hypothetical protein